MPAARSRSYICRCRRGPAICGSAAGLRYRPCCPCADSVRRRRPGLRRLITTWCHSVRSLRSPSAVLPAVSDVAMRRFDDLAAVLERAGFGIGAQIADQNHLVDAAAIAAPLRLKVGGSAESEGDGRPVGDARSGIGEREQIANHEQRPFPAIGLAPGDRDRRNALRREDEPGEEGERGRQLQRPCSRSLSDLRLASSSSPAVDRIDGPSAATATSRAAIAGISASAMSWLKPIGLTTTSIPSAIRPAIE